MLGQLAFGDIHEDVGDLEDVIDVGLYAAPPLLYLVLVAGNLPACQRYHERERREPPHYLKAFAALLQADDRDICKPEVGQVRLTATRERGGVYHT